MGTILLIILVVMLLSALPTFPYSRKWGYAPSGIASVLVIVLIVLLLMQVIPWGFNTSVSPTPLP